jgi:hypothetical protein
MQTRIDSRLDALSAALFDGVRYVTVIGSPSCAVAYNQYGFKTIPRSSALGASKDFVEMYNRTPERKR